ncbi:GNAT family N-acetyltransferase [Pseudomonas sp. CCC3.1]|uniref:GNAT family N-acetyltransferase n=1 Tax=Pseudomonas sp. CCC3.1 TaxID=3048607 RepID=UPI002AC89B57|nr:GNAT family N-acetyltransferase [Pseudomonas sp. CCC3.1]MEB0204407.1 GNAT family N-acetyltransferase [Pseudomonas sp. CCC3.1]WPX38541.1 GNAT family N-acetyltransferase [Pseudomonas sp. CCC3.1]
MTILTHFDTPISEPINAQILQLVVDHLSDISAMEIAPSNLLYSLYQYAIGFEVHLYLQALDGTKGIAVELMVATDDQDPQKVTGFVLYLPVKDDPQACGIAYMAELASHRHLGVMQAMLQAVTRRYPHTELTCSVSKVAAFQGMGFQVIGTRGPQVLMNTLDHSTDGLMGVLDVASVYQSTEVRQIHTYLLQRNGKKAMFDAEKKRDRQIDQLTAKAKAFVAQLNG